MLIGPICLVFLHLPIVHPVEIGAQIYARLIVQPCIRFLLIIPDRLFHSRQNNRLGFQSAWTGVIIPPEIMRILIFALVASFTAYAASNTPATYHKDVVPVLQKNCQACHRPGEAAPMSFLTYKDTRPWAQAIKHSVLAKKMPPWFADPHYGKFSNERKLSESELATLVSWVDGGAVEGNPKDAPKPVAFVDGWTIGKPDAIIEMPSDFKVQNSGTVEYHYVILPTNFTEDKWVERAEVRPGSRAVVHHVIAFIRPAGVKWMADQPYGVPFVPKRETRGRNSGDAESGPGGATEMLIGYAPGLQASSWAPGQAKLVPKGADLVLQLHYTTNGKETTDRSKVGLVFAKQPVKQRILTINATQARFAIPPGDSNYEVKSELTLKAPASLVSLMPHMHMRGKDFKYTAVYPGGESEVLLSVPKYAFAWQLWYEEATAKLLPAGTKIECVAHFDNSANNPTNPDPSKEVKWGDQSWEEMMIGWFDVAIDAKSDPLDLYREKKKEVAQR